MYFVPAFAGLGAPYWDMDARGAILGITGGTNYKHIVRAAIEAMAYQTKDILITMEDNSSIKISCLNVDGGASENNFLLQFQADILGIRVNKSKVTESTALGVAFLAGLAVNFYDLDDSANNNIKQRFIPNMDEKKVTLLYSKWQKAIGKAKKWEE